MWMWIKSRQERATDLALAWVQTIKLWVELKETTGGLADKDRSFVKEQLAKSADVMLGKDTAGLAGFKSKREWVVQEALARVFLSKAFSDFSNSLGELSSGELAYDQQELNSELDATMDLLRGVAK